ncbi:MAG: PAS domain S-box protein [Candidatus Viridilinea halotolerans]|uniref:Circadian input-output histidine kinase CikA n=1 Tax=Candidatus Viridilinea halotolerans TaxID=2491704 RepID=A0A426UBK7_9CHLR|nr:MAG: PAS domain S-box protein [Candidatus Viridilinea halotolerans]
MLTKNQTPEPSSMDQQLAVQAEREAGALRYRALVDALDVSLCRWLPDTTLIFTNDRYRAIFGMPADVQGQQWLDFVPEASRETTRTFYQALAADPRTVSYEHPVCVGSGDVRHYHWTDTPIFDASGTLIEFQSVGIDITDRKYAEQSQFYARKQLATIASLEHMLAATTAPDQVYALVFQGVRDLFPAAHTILVAHYDEQHEELSAVLGFHDEQEVDLTGLPAFTLAAHPKQLYGQAITTRQPLLVALDADDGLALETMVPLVSANPKPVYALLYVPMVTQERVFGIIEIHGGETGFFSIEDANAIALVANTAAVCLQNTRLYALAQRELEERIQVEAALRINERRFATIFDASPVGIGITRFSDGCVQEVNQALLQLLGRSREALLDQPIQTLGIWADLADRQCMLEQLQQAHRVTAFETTFCRGDGQRLLVLVSAELLALNNEPSILLQVVDITDRKLAEERLRANEELYRGLIQSLDNVVALVDPAGVYHYVNDVAAHALGGKADDFIGKNISEIFPLHVVAVQMAALQQVVREDRRLVTEDLTVIQGQPRWYRTALQPIHDETGHVSYVLINATDIHDLKQAQQDLQQLNQHLELRVQERTAEVQDLYDRAPTGYHSLDANGKFIRVNRTLADWLGYTRDELLGQHFTTLMTPTSQLRFYEHFLTFKQDGFIRDLEFEFIRKNGSLIPILLNATVIYDEQGSYVMSHSTTFDMTQRKADELALRESETQNRLLFDESPEAFVLFDAQRRIVRVNYAFQRLTGYGGLDFTGVALAQLVMLNSADSSLLHHATTEAQQSQQVIPAEFRLTTATGEQRHVAARIFALALKGQRHYLMALRDITIEKQAEAALRLANAELAYAAKAKDEFLANMSHELRTPLNAILAFSESMIEQVYGPITARQQVAMEHVMSSGSHLLSLINDILDLSKIEAGRLELQIESVDLSAVCEASMLFVRQQALKKRLRLKLHMVEQHFHFQADPLRLKQILVNLLSNAVKFTPDGGSVTLEVGYNAEAEVVRIAVHDTGIGIAPEDLGRLFQPFSQLDTRLSRQHAGTGLGLALVRRLALLHGGSCVVESRPDLGSTFIITLPCKPQLVVDLTSTDTEITAAAEKDAADIEPCGIQILLVEDNEVSSEVISDYLRGKGYVVFTASNGQEALDHAAVLKPALILMDIQMPEMDGFEAIQHLRARPCCATTPIIALTALAMSGDRERCLAVGANAYLTKPVKLKHLVATMRELL